MLDSYAFLKRVASSSQVKRKYTYTRWIDGRTDGHPRVTLDIIAHETRTPEKMSKSFPSLNALGSTSAAGLYS